MGTVTRKYTAESLADIAEDFHRRATGARMAAGVSTIKESSPRYRELMAIAQTWNDAALVLTQTTLKKEAP